MEPQATDQAQEFGGYLRSERELRQIPLSEVAAVTKIPLRTLQNLEAGQWDELPPQVFVRGFVRSYARCLRICEREAEQRYEQSLRNRQIHAVTQLRMQSTEEARDIESDVLGRRRFELALLVIILVILATITLSLLWRRGGHTDIQAHVAPDSTPSPKCVIEARRA